MGQCWSRDSSRFNSRTSTFLTVYNWLIWKLNFGSAKNLNDDLSNINNWAFQWKMSLNSDPNKQAQEVFFYCKIQKSSQPSLIFNNNIVTQSLTQKHLGMFLDTKLDFQEHLTSIFSKVNKTIGLLRKLHHILSRSSLLTIYVFY